MGLFDIERVRMTLDEAIKHAEEVAKEQDKLCKRYDDASGYSRSHNEDIRTTDAKRCEKCVEDHRQLAEWLKDYKRLKKQEPKWTPVKWHEITDEERRENDYPKEWACYLDSIMPYDGQRILITTKSGYVELDECYSDDGQILSLDSGYDWVDDVVAWMPLPQPYESQESEGI